MKLSVVLDPQLRASTQLVDAAQVEQAGADFIVVPESYSFDAFSVAGHLAATTSRIGIATGIVNVFSRSAALVAMSAAACDDLSDGRFVLGIGASGHQVVENFHGVPYDRPLARLAEYTAACRAIWKRDTPFVMRGETVQVPVQEGKRGLRLIYPPTRDRIPIWWASVTARSVRGAAEHADGWMPAFFSPAHAASVWRSALDEGRSRRDPALGELDVVAGGTAVVDDTMDEDARRRALEPIKAHIALYVGVMGSRDRNFYRDLCDGFGFADAARRIQEASLDGRRAEAIAAVPDELADAISLVGCRARVRDRIQMYRDAGVTVLHVSIPHHDRARVVSELKELIG